MGVQHSLSTRSVVPMYVCVALEGLRRQNSPFLFLIFGNQTQTSNKNIYHISEKGLVRRHLYSCSKTVEIRIIASYSGVRINSTERRHSSSFKCHFHKLFGCYKLDHVALTEDDNESEVNENLVKICIKVQLSIKVRLLMRNKQSETMNAECYSYSCKCSRKHGHRKFKRCRRCSYKKFLLNDTR